MSQNQWRVVKLDPSHCWRRMCAVYSQCSGDSSALRGDSRYPPQGRSPGSLKPGPAEWSSCYPTDRQGSWGSPRRWASFARLCPPPARGGPSCCYPHSAVLRLEFDSSSSVEGVLRVSVKPICCRKEKARATRSFAVESRRSPERNHRLRLVRRSVFWSVA